jgi:hypothetical protein
MPVGIVEVMNSTNYTLSYNNRESGYQFTIGPKTDEYENNDWVPSSNFHDDTLPYYSSGYYLELKLGDLSPMKISDDKWKFSIVGPTGHAGEEAQTMVDNIL